MNDREFYLSHQLPIIGVSVVVWLLTVLLFWVYTAEFDHRMKEAKAARIKEEEKNSYLHGQLEECRSLNTLWINTLWDARKVEENDRSSTNPDSAP